MGCVLSIDISLTFLFYFLFTFSDCVSSKTANARLDERDWSLAIGVSVRKIKGFDPKARESRFTRKGCRCMHVTCEVQSSCHVSDRNARILEYFIN